MKHIICENIARSVEKNIASQYSLMNDIDKRTIGIGGLLSLKDLLCDPETLPIGSVEFIQEAMRVAGIPHQPNISYPDCLIAYMGRGIREITISELVSGLEIPVFVKPVDTKLFTGFVLSETTQETDQPEFFDLPLGTRVWVSDVVTFNAEYRYYVIGGEIIGVGRYDEFDNSLSPDLIIVEQMVREFSANGAPSAYSIDVGVTDSGETRLVECNDAWALGYYRGTLSYKDYIHLLSVRWKELLTSR